MTFSFSRDAESSERSAGRTPALRSEDSAARLNHWFFPRCHSTSSFPLPFSTRAITNSRSDKRFK